MSLFDDDDDDVGSIDDGKPIAKIQNASENIQQLISSLFSNEINDNGVSLFGDQPKRKRCSHPLSASTRIAPNHLCSPYTWLIGQVDYQKVNITAGTPMHPFPRKSRVSYN
jgi:hypothetical protein